MAGITDEHLGWIRDEIGSSTPPTDDDLAESWDELGHWILVALRVLRRRRADAVTGGTSQPSAVAIPGVVSVSAATPNVRALDAQIDALVARYERETGEDIEGPGIGSTTLTRATWR